MKFIEFRARWDLKEGDQVAQICKGRIIIKRVNGKIGIWDFEGNNIIPEKEVVECECIGLEDSIYKTQHLKSNEYVFIIQEANGKFSIYNYNGKKFECGEIDEYKIFRNTILVSRSKQKGVISLKTGKTIIPIEFEKIENKFHSEYTYKYGEIYKVYKNGKCGCYSENAGCILPAEFDNWDWRAQEENFNVTNNDLYGIYNFEGKEIVPINFLPEITTIIKVIKKDIDYPQFNKYMKVYIVRAKSNQYGVYSEDGENLIPVKYDQIETNEELAGFPFIVNAEGLYELYSLDGKKLLEDKYELISTLELICAYKCYARFLLVKNNGLFGLYLIDNNKLIKSQFDEVKWDSEYGLFVRKGNLNGLYSPDGKCILKVEYIKITKESIYNIPEWKWGSYLKVESANGLYGFYHRNRLIEPEYEQVSILEYSETDLLLVKNGIYDIYSSSGEIILKGCNELKLLIIKENFGNKTKELPDVYVFKKEELYGFYFFKKGKKVIEPQFDDYYYFTGRKDSWGYRIIGEKDGEKVVFNRFGFVMN